MIPDFPIPIGWGFAAQSSGSTAWQVHYRFGKVGDVIKAVADGYHFLAPGLPAFGFTQSPARGEYEHTPLQANRDALSDCS